MTGPTEIPPISPLGVAAWALYDWANSAFPTVIITFVYLPHISRKELSRTTSPGLVSGATP